MSTYIPSDHAEFVDALRGCLGLAPLYSADKSSEYRHEIVWPGARCPPATPYSGIPKPESGGLVEHIDERVTIAMAKKRSRT